jgi:hypothetical protein
MKVFSLTLPDLVNEVIFLAERCMCVS